MPIRYEDVFIAITEAKPKLPKPLLSWLFKADLELKWVELIISSNERSRTLIMKFIDAQDAKVTQLFGEEKVAKEAAEAKQDEYKASINPVASTKERDAAKHKYELAVQARVNAQNEYETFRTATKAASAPKAASAAPKQNKETKEDKEEKKLVARFNALESPRTVKRFRQPTVVGPRRGHCLCKNNCANNCSCLKSGVGCNSKCGCDCDRDDPNDDDDDGDDTVPVKRQKSAAAKPKVAVAASTFPDTVFGRAAAAEAAAGAGGGAT